MVRRLDLQFGDRRIWWRQRPLHRAARHLILHDPIGERVAVGLARSLLYLFRENSTMTQRPLFAILLLLSTALVAPPALAQDSAAPAADSPAAPQDEQQGDVSITGGVDQEIVLTGRFPPKAVPAHPEMLVIFSQAHNTRRTPDM